MSHIKHAKILGISIALALGISAASPSAYAQDDEYWTYEMQQGDNVWTIAHELLTDWRKWQEITELNNVSNDRIMAAGTLLQIPRDFIQERPATVQLVEVSGPVSLISQAGATKEIDDAIVLAGDVITTGENGSVLIKFEDQTEILITPNSELVIDEAQVIGSDNNFTDINVKLNKGEAEIHANPNKQSGSRFIIQTPTAFATTRGTVYRVRANDDSTAAEVTQGKIDVTNALGNTRVPKRFGTLAYKNEAPRKPVKLLSEPDLEAPDDIRYLPARVSWQTLNKAVNYRAQISDQADFSRIVLDTQSPVAKLNIPVELPDGQYWLRVRGIDNNDLQGLSTVKPFTIDARPFPPVIQAPLSTDQVYAGEVSFNWTQPENVVKYHFEIATDEQFTSPVAIFEPTTEQTQTLTLEQPGQYFWRVTSEDNRGKVGPKGHTYPLTVKPVPATPELEAPVTSEDTLGFGWQPDDITVSYQVQLSNDPSFEEVLQDVTVPESSAVLQKPEMGTYYFRVRGFDSDNFAGGWSATQQIEVPLDSYLPAIIWTAFTVILFL